jgi:hypothetical protein
MASNMIEMQPYNQGVQRQRTALDNCTYHVGRLEHITQRGVTTLQGRRNDYKNSKQRFVGLLRLHRASDPELFAQAFNIEYLKNERKEEIDHARDNLRYQRTHNRQQLTQLATYKTKRAEAQQLLERANLDTTTMIRINRKELREALKNISNASNPRIEVRGPKIKVTLDFTDMHMSCLPEHQNTADFIAKSINAHLGVEQINPNKIPLPPSRVRLILDTSTGGTSMRAITTHGPEYNYHAPGGHRPNPHWLSPGGPCLGDFGGPITESISTADFTTAMQLIHMYLSTYNLDDSVGVTAPFYGVTREQGALLHHRHRRISFNTWQEYMLNASVGDYTDLHHYLPAHRPTGVMEIDAAAEFTINPEPVRREYTERDLRPNPATTVPNNERFTTDAEGHPIHIIAA